MCGGGGGGGGGGRGRSLHLHLSTLINLTILIEQAMIMVRSLKIGGNSNRAP